MSMVEFTPRAEKSLLDILGQESRPENSLLVVDMSQGDVQLSFKNPDDLESLQRDVDMVGPFRVPIGGQKMSLFVRDGESAVGGVVELDYAAYEGKRCFQIRAAR